MKLLAAAFVLVLLSVAEEGRAVKLIRTRRQLQSPLHLGGIRDPYGSYCERRGGCCPGREDSCTVPYLDTICYCDLFCNRTVSDCCPDFWGHCLGEPQPSGYRKYCERNGHRFPSGATYKENCNLCTCSKDGRWDCENHACLVEADMIHAINRGNYGWRAGNYSQFWGMSLDEGIRYRLGTNKPSRTVSNMNEMKTNLENVFLPNYFNAADKWPGKIHKPLDQGNCAASWAFSTAAVASDRISIQSMGHMTPMLSPQNLISCDTRNQGGCRGGQIDGAWWYLRRRGIVTEDCYPFSSSKTDSASQRPPCMMHSQSVGRGKRQATARCPSQSSSTNDIYQSTPAYRISSNEKEIMKEIMDNGPVQAILEVYEDFFVYKSGVYRHSPVNNNKPPQFRKHGTHSVKITGWGEERGYNGERSKYWIAANSWGINWGENGYFKIARGENECEIETFVLGVWGRVTMEDMHHRK
ncbi:TINAL protein, partial [Polyodon spathula]|nr:TINAL protein [Polyodon spathula]